MGGVNEEEDRRAKEEMGISTDAPTGAVKFVYSWSIIILVALLVYGTFVLFKRRSLAYAGVALAFITQYSLLMLILLPQGVITTDDRDLEESVYGWYGQLPVLMAFFYYAQVIFGCVFLGLGAIKVYVVDRIFGPAAEAEYQKEAAESEYTSASKLDI